MIDDLLDECRHYIRTERPPVDATGDVFADILLAAVFVHMARAETISARLTILLRYDCDSCPPKALPVVRKWAGELHDAATRPRQIPAGTDLAPQLPNPFVRRPIPIVTAEQYRAMTTREAAEFEADRQRHPIATIMDWSRGK